MSWRKLLRYLFFLRRPEEEEMSSDDLLTMDTHVEDESIVDEEGLMVEHGEVVGETAIITAEKQLQPTGGPLPERYSHLVLPSTCCNVFQLILDSNNSTLLIPIGSFCFEPVIESHILSSSSEDQPLTARPCLLTKSTF